MLVWIPALVFASKAAFISALLNHAYLWVLYYTLELLDIRWIYSNQLT